MKDLSVYYCPGCGRYTFSQPSEVADCSICNLSMVLLTRYSDFRTLTKEERDRLLLQNMIAGNPSISSRFLDYMRSCSVSKANAPQDPYLHKLETENKELKELQAKANKYNSLIKEIEEKIKEIGEYSDMARELIEEKIVIADSDSLNFGRQQAHNKDREVLRELLYKQKEKV